MFTLKAPSPTFLGVLQTVARSATENWKLQVKWNGSKKSFTDCRTFIEVGWNVEFVLLGCSNLAEWTAAIKGITEHEIAHNLFSQSSVVKGSEVLPIPELIAYFKRMHKSGMSKDIANFIRGALEDGRVNRLHVNVSPATIASLQWVNELLYRNSCELMRKEDRSPLVWALNSFLERTRCGKDLAGVPVDTVRFLDTLQELIEVGLFATSSGEMVTTSALPIAEAFVDEFPDLFVPAHMLPKVENGEHSPSEGDESSDRGKSVPERGMDVRRPKKKPKPEPKETTEAEVSASPSEVKPTEDVDENVEEESVIPSKDDSIDEGKPELEESASGNEELPEESTKESPESDLVSEEEEMGSGEVKDAESDDCGCEATAESSGDEPESTEGGSEESSESESESGSDEEITSDGDREELSDEELTSEGDSEELSNEDAEWVDGEEESGPIKSDVNPDFSPSTADDKTVDVGGGEATSTDRFLGESIEEANATEDEAAEALEKISSWVETEEVEEDLDFSELFSASESEAIEFSTKDEALEKEVRAAREVASEFEKVDTRLFSVGIHSKVNFSEFQAPENPRMADLYTQERENMSKLIDETGDALREYLVHKKQSAQRNLRSGRIDSRRLWRASSGMLDGRVFMEREAPSSPTDVAVYLLLDMSGSMDHYGRIESARKAAVILTETLEEFGVAHTVVAFTADTYYEESVEHYRLVRWDEKEKQRIMFYHAALNNRDGYSLRVATEELSRRPEKTKILLMLSDGLPVAANCVARGGILDPRDRILNDVASAIDEAIEKKVEVLHLYFGDAGKETLEKVSFMYPKLSVITNPVDVPGAVADILVSTLRKYM